MSLIKLSLIDETAFLFNADGKFLYSQSKNVCFDSTQI